MCTRFLKRLGRLLGPVIGATAVVALLGLGLGPRLGGYRVMTVLSASMRPTMAEGSLIVQTAVPLNRVGVGDVVTYRIPTEDRRVVTHRVVEVVMAGDHPVVRTKGDANAAPDPWLARLEGDRIWSVRFALPRAGYAVQALRQPWAQRLALLGVPFVLALVWLRDIWAPRDRPRSSSSATAPIPSTYAAPARVGPWRSALALSALGALALLDRSVMSPRPHRVGRKLA